MERQECKFVRYAASEGKSLKYTLKYYIGGKLVECPVCAERDALIDETILVGEVEEISTEEYFEWFNSEGRNWVIGGL